MYHDWVYPKPALVVFSVQFNPIQHFHKAYSSLSCTTGALVVTYLLFIFPLGGEVLFSSALLTPGVDHGREGMKGKGKGRMDGIYVFYDSLLLLYYTRQGVELEE